MPVSLEDHVQERLAAIAERIARAAERSRRSPAGVRLIAVSKTFPAEYVRAAARAGQVDFGENRVQEGAEKIPEAPVGLRWHLVGHLQGNKARKAAALFSWIHSIDSADLLVKVDRSAVEAGTRPNVLLQVDLAGEATKHGARPEELDGIVAAARECQAAHLVGLMTLPPFFDDPEDARPYFRKLREIAEDLASRGVPPGMLEQLSMGMSHDFEVAIEEGATLVRIGTAIFGERAYR